MPKYTIPALAAMAALLLSGCETSTLDVAAMPTAAQLADYQRCMDIDYPQVGFGKYSSPTECWIFYVKKKPSVAKKAADGAGQIDPVPDRAHLPGGGSPQPAVNLGGSTAVAGDGAAAAAGAQGTATAGDGAAAAAGNGGVAAAGGGAAAAAGPGGAAAAGGGAAAVTGPGGETITAGNGIPSLSRVEIGAH